MREEKTLSSQLVYEGRAVRLRIDTVLTAGGRETTREIVEHSDCVAIIAVDADNSVLLVNQFRQAVGKVLLEIPAGGIEVNEDPVTAVSRELREETGYLPRKVIKLGGFYAVPGYGTEYLHLYLATDLVANPLYAEDTEAIRLSRMPVSQLASLLASGKICDAKSIAGLLIFLNSHTNLNL